MCQSGTYICVIGEYPSLLLIYLKCSERFGTPPPCPTDNQQYDKGATPYPFAYIETTRTDVTKHSSTSPQCPTTKPTVHRNNDHSTTRQRQETQAHTTTAPHTKDHSTARQRHQRRRPTATATATATADGERQRRRQRRRQRQRQTANGDGNGNGNGTPPHQRQRPLQGPPFGGTGPPLPTRLRRCQSGTGVCRHFSAAFVNSAALKCRQPQVGSRPGCRLRALALPPQHDPNDHHNHTQNGNERRQMTTQIVTAPKKNGT